MTRKTTSWMFGLAVFALAGCSDDPEQTSKAAPAESDSALSQSDQTSEVTVKASSRSTTGGSARNLPEYLDQNWDHETRMEWWYTPQGSRVLPYDWFLALERPGSQELVRSKDNLEAFRFIAWPADPKWNPDGLPIGLVADKDAETGERHFGFNCSACHTGKFHYNGKAYLVEGGPAHNDFDRFVTEIVDAMKTTANDEDKFARFAVRVLGENADTADIAALKDELAKESARQGERVKTNRPPHPNGYARLDAFGNIFNEGSVFAISEPANAKPSNAPVSFPVLWDTPHHDIVQWNGAAVNAGIGPYTRNVGEVVGVFGDLRVSEVEELGEKKLRYESHINIKNLERLEEILTSLWSPKWPEEVLPAIDASKAKRGKQHYDKTCAGCHQPIDRTDPGRKVAAKMIPVDKIGTDPTMAVNVATSVGKTGIMKGTLMIPITKHTPSLGIIDTFEDEAPTARIVGNGVIGVIREELGFIKLVKGLPDYIRAAKKNALFPNCDPKKEANKCLRPPRYKARPLNGIWASAPFLHNGSVPSLWELLKEPGKRVDTFHVGSWAMDPEMVGFIADYGEDTSEFDTTLIGNSNLGHSHGTDLADEEKWDLIEYIKTL